MKKKQDLEKMPLRMPLRQSNRTESCCDSLEHARPERRDAAENRQRILAVSNQLFGERGIENVTMSQIAKAAGIGQGTLYRRYANKGELCIALLKANLPQLRNEVDQYLEQTAASMSKLGQLNSVLERLVNFIEEQLPLLGAIEDAAVKHKRGMQFHNPWYEWMHQTVSGLLNEAIAQDEILPLNTTFTADAVLATLNIDLYLFQRSDRGFTPEQILQGTRWIYIERLKQS
ncbi:MAG TPA: TetR/AcrR family transcriptional regulator [Coleofasciculaceae cyanobacterium]